MTFSVVIEAVIASAFFLNLYKLRDATLSLLNLLTDWGPTRRLTHIFPSKRAKALEEFNLSQGIWSEDTLTSDIEKYLEDFEIESREKEEKFSKTIEELKKASLNADLEITIPKDDMFPAAHLPIFLWLVLYLSGYFTRFMNQSFLYQIGVLGLFAWFCWAVSYRWKYQKFWGERWGLLNSRIRENTHPRTRLRSL